MTDLELGFLAGFLTAMLLVIYTKYIKSLKP